MARWVLSNCCRCLELWIRNQPARNAVLAFASFPRWCRSWSGAETRARRGAAQIPYAQRSRASFLASYFAFFFFDFVLFDLPGVAPARVGTDPPQRQSPKPARQECACPAPPPSAPHSGESPGSSAVPSAVAWPCPVYRMRDAMPRATERHSAGRGQTPRPDPIDR